PRLRRNAGTSKSACSKLAIIALRMVSTSLDADGTDATADDPNPLPEADTADGPGSDSITMLRGESDSKSSDPELMVKPVDSVRRRGRSSSLNPVAMTVILTASFIF